ncbi:polyunsaturated fatty acid lipoxygenase ALOX15B-like isoform X1 [Oreochromis aureus]|uniref:Arachidonate 15-lipoxygenase type B n=1 Tax=Oreochromis aureus TaxID=47969 RepID=A0A668TWJ5_OREAU|nr:polyunsaturated fatty acid lipoxygenase ALOX15B-like isoform X1 [Oreochromis aureus]XP_039463063.1 polyunsaturated fatty acid lipoxygenase ALOX15B-like isoform X1 [Oreochromis aureus]
MVDYEVIVLTGSLGFATTFDNIYIKLVGLNGSSKRKCLWSCMPSFYSGAVSRFTVTCPVSLGELLLIEVDKEHRLLLPDMSWYAAKVEVTSPEGDTYHFPIYQWITNSDVHRFKEGKALRASQEKNSLLAKYSRQEELEKQQQVYCWEKEGIAHCMKADNAQSLPYDIRFSLTKTAEMTYISAKGLGQMGLMQILEWKKEFTRMEDISLLLHIHQTKRSDYVQKHWKEDAFFGYQFLNGVNPILIRRCTALPDNFRVTDKMVFPDDQHNLKDEMTKGNIFLCDYKLLDGVQANTINGKKQYLMAPLVLLRKNEEDQLMPIAIQLKQKPAEDNPVFLPTDSEYDWLLAKIFVRSADFNLYELNAHLLRAHLLAEVFTVSLLRNLPMVHPLYKLLRPHTRYTLQINYLARDLLISENGSFAKFTASGGKGAAEILKKSLATVTYTSLCIPDDIEERGLKDVPNFYYRDDGLKLWDIIHRFVEPVLTHYYETDADVQEDHELQNWIKEIFEHGFLSNNNSGIPQKFTTKNEMVKFVTMVIFTCSAQHSAVNSGQYDFGGWMPNSPTSLQLPPPTTKETATEKTMLDTFPSVNTTVHAMATLWLLSKESSDRVLLGHFPEEHFTDKFPRKRIMEFQEELQRLSAEIKTRNKDLDLPYTYLDPKVIENSVSI